VDRHTRKELKTDKFAKEVTHTFEVLSEHSTEVKRYGAIALVVIVAAAGIYFYNGRQTTMREDALAQALHLDDATVGPTAGNDPQQQANLHFNTKEEKDKARDKAFVDVAAKYHGTQEGSIAAMYLASDVADKGDLAGAEKQFKAIMDSAPKDYAALARLSLAQIYAGEGKTADAEKLLRYAVANPAATVSKEEATIELAKLIGKTDPAQARKMLEPLRTERAAVSRAAVTALGELPQTAN
jgi:predicted negative regulator of RcsB-dependent stress response